MISSVVLWRWRGIELLPLSDIEHRRAMLQAHPRSHPYMTNAIQQVGFRCDRQTGSAIFAPRAIHDYIQFAEVNTVSDDDETTGLRFSARVPDLPFGCLIGF